MKITKEIKNLCEVIYEIKNYANLSDDDWEITSYFEYDYTHNIEFEIQNRKIDSRLTFNIDRDYNLVSYDVKGREESIEVYRKFLTIIEYMETTFDTTKSKLQNFIKYDRSNK